MERPTCKMMFQVLALLSGIIAAIFLPWRVGGAETGPPIVEVRPNYEKPKNRAIDDVLNRCLDDLSQAQNELRSLYAEGKVQRRPDMQGIWKAPITLSNGFLAVGFPSETGPVGQVIKRVFTDGHPKRELREQSYDIIYYNDGKVRKYILRDDAGLEFYPTGGLKSFSAQIDERTSCSASWDADGKLLGDGTSSHPPRSEQGLPEWAKALRDGDFQVRSGAAGEMARIGPASIPYALAVLKDGNDGAREQAAVVFLLLGEGAAPTVPDLIRCLRGDKDPVVRTYIGRALGLVGPAAKTAIPALEEAATNSDTDVASAAKAALDRIRRSSVE